jgi:guanine deaminase
MHFFGWFAERLLDFQADSSITRTEKRNRMDEQFLAEAIRLAVESVEAGGGPFGAVIVREGTIIGRGTNRVTLSNDPTAHAEIEAIRRACAGLGDFRLSDCVLYTSCEPCPMCLSACYWARLSAIVYSGTQADAAEAGFDDAFLYRELSLPISQRTLPAKQLFAADGDLPFEAWKNFTGRVEY